MTDYQKPMHTETASVDDENEDGSVEMLAWAIVLVMAIGCFVIWGFA